MTAAIATRVAETWAIAAALQLVLWAVQQRTRNVGIVDVGWPASFALVVAVLAAGAAAPTAAWAPIAAITCAWSLRLAGYLIARGAAIAAGGAVGETVADAQLARWRRDPSRCDQVCDAGLWSVSRHPNYFSEWCVWLGHAVYGLAFAPAGLVALAPQAILLASILKVTGIPATEAQALRSKGDAYRDYQRRVSAFVPCRGAWLVAARWVTARIAAMASLCCVDCAASRGPPLGLGRESVLPMRSSPPI